MSEEINRPTPASPETQPGAVRDELQQRDVSHQGQKLEASPEADDAQKHMGATEDQVTPVTPPMEGPANLTSQEDSSPANDSIDPQTEITPG